MPEGGTAPSSGNRLIYSIQRTYIIEPVFKPDKLIFTCDERIDIPTIEPLPNVQPVLYEGQPLTVIPCIELVGELLSEVNLTFETNEGETVLPIKIGSGRQYPSENPYLHSRYVLVLPRGTTGVKTCKIIESGIEPEIGVKLQHNFTFGIMPPPYNYDNVLFGCLSYAVGVNSNTIEQINQDVDNLSTEFQKAMFLSARGEAKPSETYNIGQNGFIRISGNPRFIRGTLQHRNTRPWRVDFYFSDHEEDTLKTRVYIPAGNSVLLLDLITGQLCVTTTNEEDVRSVTYPLPLLTKARNISVNWAWVVPTQGNLNMEVQQWA